MQELIIYMGLPGSGKSTVAAAELSRSPGTMRVVCKDDIRKAHPPTDGKWTTDYEKSVVMPQEASDIMAHLRNGYTVIVDSTNFAHEDRLRALARTAQVPVRVRYFPCDLDTCILRDSLRPEPVGEKVIRSMANTFADQMLYKSLVPVVQPIPGELPRFAPAIIVDVDGTIALPGKRGPYELEKAADDVPNYPVLQSVRAHWIRMTDVLVVTARDEQYRALTEEWLQKKALLHYKGLYMRPRGDVRRDTVVKAELFDTYIRNRYWVQAVFEDRTRCVKMWRALGLLCLQVNDGNY